MAAAQPPACFHRGWSHWVMCTLGGGLRSSSGCLLRCKHKREDVKSTFISHDLSSAANFHLAVWNRGGGTADGFKTNRAAGSRHQSESMCANERVTWILNLTAWLPEAWSYCFAHWWGYHVLKSDFRVKVQIERFLKTNWSWVEIKDQSLFWSFDFYNELLKTFFCCCFHRMGRNVRHNLVCEFLRESVVSSAKSADNIIAAWPFQLKLLTLTHRWKSCECL